MCGYYFSKKFETPPSRFFRQKPDWSVATLCQGTKEFMTVHLKLLDPESVERDSIVSITKTILFKNANKKALRGLF